MNGVFGLFCLAGTLCFLGLANKRPVRGAIEIAWGVELYPGELYGAAVARAYELESDVAQYPRIVVGSEAVKYLRLHLANTELDPFSLNDKALAELCLSMLVQDIDGYWLLHYLGEEFQYAVSHSHHAELYTAALNFVHEQLSAHQANRNTKISFRYSHLMQYFDDHPPPTPKQTR
jgi:aminoglycoside/choline kinase family phosphotransferase